MAETSIQWAHYTFNPWVGCQRVSPGCHNCYAEAYDKRVGGVPKSQRVGGVAQLRWGPKAPRVRTSPANWKLPVRWNAAAAAACERRRVFCASLADVFEDRPELVPWREELFGLIAYTRHLDWLLLTKRPENIAWLWPNHICMPGDDCNLVAAPTPGPTGWPNVWLGTTVEDQERADERIPRLMAAPAAVHFLSCEPLLQRVDLQLDSGHETNGPQGWVADPQPDWVIIGGESGPGARSFRLDWARDLVRQCRSAGVAPFVKQLGSNPHGEWGPGEPPTHHLLDITVWPPRESTELSRFKNGRWKLTDHHGGTPTEWPLDLRVREFPEVHRASP